MLRKIQPMYNKVFNALMQTLSIKRHDNAFPFCVKECQAAIARTFFCF